MKESFTIINEPYKGKYLLRFNEQTAASKTMKYKAACHAWDNLDCNLEAIVLEDKGENSMKAAYPNHHKNWIMKMLLSGLFIISSGSQLQIESLSSPFSELSFPDFRFAIYRYCDKFLKRILTYIHNNVNILPRDQIV